MRKYLCLVFGLFLLVSLKGQQEKGGRRLQVKLHYTGTGAVDEKHKIFAVLFDTPNFTSNGGGAIPIMVKAATGKDETVTFSDITTSPVYAAASYDPSGNYDGQSPPPSGASLGMYAKTPGKPEPIALEPGKTVQIEVPFDDSVKMP
jgi:hypothetical protein